MPSLNQSASDVIDLETEDAMPPAKRSRKSLPRVEIGSFFVDPVGLGTMPLGIEYPLPSRRPARTSAIDMLHTAFETGVEILDTADSYYAGPGGTAEASSPHYVEKLIAESLRSYKKDVRNIRICTKGGMQRIDSTSRGWRPRVCSRSVVGALISASFEALGSRPIDIYMLHHTNTLLDHQLEDALQVMHDALKDGTVLSLGLANASIPNLQLAERLGVPISVVQNQYSLWQRDAEMPWSRDASGTCKKGILDWCASRGIAFMPYGVCGGVRQRDGRQTLEGDFPLLVDIARRNHCSPNALVMAWMRHRYPFIVHIVGARSKQHILDCASVRKLSLSQVDIEEISGIQPRRTPVNKALCSSRLSLIYTEVGDLANAGVHLLTDLENDLQLLARDLQCQIHVDADNDRIILQNSSAEQDASLVSTLNEIMQFYFGHGLP